MYVVERFHSIYTSIALKLEYQPLYIRVQSLVPNISPRNRIFWYSLRWLILVLPRGLQEEYPSFSINHLLYPCNRPINAGQGSLVDHIAGNLPSHTQSFYKSAQPSAWLLKLHPLSYMKKGAKIKSYLTQLTRITATLGSTANKAIVNLYLGLILGGNHSSMLMEFNSNEYTKDYDAMRDKCQAEMCIQDYKSDQI